MTNKLATLKKLYNCPNEASGSLYSLQYLERSRNVVLLLPVVVLYLEVRPGKLLQQLPAAAAHQLCLHVLYKRILLHRSIDYSTKKSCDGNYCV